MSGRRFKAELDEAAKDRYLEAYRFIADMMKKMGIDDPRELNKVKFLATRKYKLPRVPTNVEILSFLRDREPMLGKKLVLKPVRSLSGVVVVAIMTYPFECPHGRCLYCPHYPGAPVSYTGKEPSAMRGISNDFDPLKQVRSRLTQLELMGHAIDKVEVIIQGGTFNTTPKYYREWFMRRLLEAFIGYFPRDFNKGLLDAETSRNRIIGITFETRPDACDEDQINWMLERGGTRVEIGVQTIYDDVFKAVNRGHYTRDVVEATRRLKDAGFKVTYHLMPGLPKTSLKHDLNIFKTIFSSHNYMPDNLKIYPTLVLEHTGLIALWRRGLYKPYSTYDASILTEVIKHNFIPKWIRIMRINRDIPSFEVVDGVKKTNLRQIVQSEMKLMGLRCRCIRCREVGHKLFKENYVPSNNIEITLTKYIASDGLEFFIAVEDVEKDVIFGFLRLRRPSQNVWRPEIASSETYLVRELHVYGQSLPIGETHLEYWRSWQHRGLGSLLLNKAEELTSSFGGEKIVVISGVGVREYYYSHGYRGEGPYVSKYIR